MRVCSTSARLGLLGLILAGLVSTTAAPAAEFYVDNRTGDDAYDGQSARSLEGAAGPFRSIRRALNLARGGDVIALTNTGDPYFEPITLDGPRYSGNPQIPFVIEGNGAVVSGARLVPPIAWQYVGQSVWRFRPYRKGYYQLLLRGAVLPEVRSNPSANRPAELAEGEWTAFKGTVYYRALQGIGQAAPELPLEFAYEGCGIVLVNVQNVVIRNLTVQHFREDGANAHDRAKNVILENVRLLENGRTGFAASGTSLVGLTHCTLHGNREEQVLNAEVAQTELDQCDLGDLNPFRIRGGHLLIDGKEVFSKTAARLPVKPRRPQIVFIPTPQLLIK